MARTYGAVGAATKINAEGLFELFTSRTGVTRRECEDELGIDSQQFDRAKAYLKDLFQVGDDERDPNPLTYDPTTHRYKFAKYEAEANTYDTWVLRRQVTHARRHLEFLKSVAQKWPDSRQAKRAVRMGEFFVDELEELLAEVSS